jgi:hypothetical protein
LATPNKRAVRLQRVSGFDANAGSAVLMPKPKAAAGMHFRIMIWDHGGWVFRQHAANRAACKHVAEQARAMGYRVKFERIPIGFEAPKDLKDRKKHRPAQKLLETVATTSGNSSPTSMTNFVKRSELVDALVRKLREVRKAGSKIPFSEAELNFLLSRFS